MGNTAYLLATRLTESFAKYRWCPNIIGPQSGGAVEDLPVHLFESFGQLEAKIPTEVLITDRREYEMADEGFIALTMRKGSDNAAFFSANSVQKPKQFPNTKEGKEAETNYKLGTQLPYMMIVNRLAHYIKVLQREQIGSWKERQDLERELNTWIRQYVADQENPPAEVRSRRPCARHRSPSLTWKAIRAGTRCPWRFGPTSSTWVPTSNCHWLAGWTRINPCSSTRPATDRRPAAAACSRDWSRLPNRPARVWEKSPTLLNPSSAIWFGC